jgi:hypothetical protein
MPEEHNMQHEAEQAVEELRKRFAPLVERLSPEIEPAVVFSCAPAPATEPNK